MCILVLIKCELSNLDLTIILFPIIYIQIPVIFISPL